MKNYDFWSNKMVIQLVKFYNEALLPEIADPRLCRKIPRKCNWIQFIENEHIMK